MKIKRILISIGLVPLLVSVLFFPVSSALASQNAQTALGEENFITNIVFGPKTPNILGVNQKVTLSFSYSTEEPDGVLIFAEPFTDGSPTSGYATGGSPIYPAANNGTGTFYFTITSGTQLVDQVYITMWDARQTDLLFATILPVYFLFSDQSNLVTNIVFHTSTPNVLGVDDYLDFDFDYQNETDGNVRIWIRPFTSGNKTPGYGAHGSPAYPPGIGSSDGFFTITDNQAVVDQIRIQMWDEDETELLFEAFLPVYYLFSDQPNLVTNLSFHIDTPNIIYLNDYIDFDFHYQNSTQGDVRIWTLPFTEGSETYGYGVHGSPAYATGAGEGDGFFGLRITQEIVDQYRIQMWDDDSTTLLFEAFLPVYYNCLKPTNKNLIIFVTKHGIFLSNETLTLENGQTCNVIINNPLGLSYSMYWDNSSDYDITIDWYGYDNGGIIAKAAGSETITFHISSEYGRYSASCDVTVMPTDAQDTQEGNTNGNINNAGNFDIGGDGIYYGGSRLYKYTEDFNSSSVIIDDPWVTNIQVIDDWVYYCNGYDNADPDSYLSLRKVKTDGSDKQILTYDECISMHVSGDYIYYSNRDDAFSIYRIKTDGTDREKLNDYNSIQLCLADDWIFFTNRSDNNKIYRMSFDGSIDNCVIDEPCAYLDALDQCLYYVSAEDGCLYQATLDGKDKFQVTNDLCGTMNVTDEWIYYSNESDGGDLYRISSSGLKREKLTDGYDCHTIHIIDDWIIYAYSTPNSVGGSDWHGFLMMKTDGSEKRDFTIH